MGRRSWTTITVRRTANRGGWSGVTGTSSVIDGLLDRRADVPGALLLSGEPGVGKTALLDAAARRASAAGVRVLRAAGAEFETDMTYSASEPATSSPP